MTRFMHHFLLSSHWSTRRSWASKSLKESWVSKARFYHWTLKAHTYLLPASLGRGHFNWPLRPYQQYSSPLNNVDLNCMGPLICRYFSVLNTTVLHNLRLIEFVSRGHTINYTISYTWFSTTRRVCVPSPSLFEGQLYLKIHRGRGILIEGICLQSYFEYCLFSWPKEIL